MHCGINLSYNDTHRQVTLNGDLLKLTADMATLPDFTPKQQAAGDTLQLPALSFGYYVFKNVKAKACMIT